jgi:hypothetical protein
VKRVPLVNSWLALFQNGPTVVTLAHGEGHGVEITTESTAADRFALDVHNTARTLLRVRNDGNVGIGTANPGSLLHLFGASPVLKILQDPGIPGGARLQMSAAGSSVDKVQILIHGVTLESAAGGGNDYLKISNGSAQQPLAYFSAYGLVGLGRTPGVNHLEIEGNASKTAAGAWLANSDVRIKEDIEPVESALDTLDRVRLVSFRYTDEYRQAHPSIEDRRYVNVVAQEFRGVFPDDVSGSGEKLSDGHEILQVDVHPLTIYSAAAIQELHQRMKSKDAEIQDLKQAVAELKTLVQDLAGKANGSR